MFIRQSAFEGNQKMLKGGLHCHTTRSDGEVAPDEVIRLHAENGYDFLALTDHRLYNRKNFAPDVAMTIVPGMEYDEIIDGPAEKGGGFRCYHTLVLGPDDETNPFEHDQKFKTVVHQKGTTLTQEEYQPCLDYFHENNNITIYCHPQWSSTPTRYFDRLEGDIALEIWNSGCALGGGADSDNAIYWDELLGMGKKVFAVATDDGHERQHHCKGWVMVRAENNVPAILQALKNGDFYASCGPNIYDFYVDGDVVTVKCDPCSQVQFYADRHPIIRVSGEEMETAIFDMSKDWSGAYDYIRASVVDAQGRRAWTNPIYLK